MLKNKFLKKFKSISPFLNEKTLRIWCATEAINLGWGGISFVSSITGISIPRIKRGIKEIEAGNNVKKNRIRKKGGGRKKVTEKYPLILKKVDEIVEACTRGDPESLLKWSSKSSYKIVTELEKQNIKISQRTLCDILSELGYSLQANKKTKEGKDHPNRDEQFKYINKKSKKFQKENYPVISVDAKKKELIGNFKNNGKEYCKKKAPIQVNTHDFPDKEKGKVAPYGVYDIGKNKGWVSVGITKDTAEFAVNSIRSWWYQMGKEDYAEAKKIFITADCGGSNGYRTKLWKWELQKLSNELKKELHISHYPPGTSKWNKIEHKMFSYISQNWRGRPLITREIVVNLIGNTRTKTGLKIKSQLDLRQYKTGIEISQEQIESMNLQKFKFQGEWNYKISPQN
jgi:transposase